MELEGIQTGWYFSTNDGWRSKFIFYDPAFKMYIGKTKLEHTGVIDVKVYTEKDMSIWRSRRRGSTLEV